MERHKLMRIMIGITGVLVIIGVILMWWMLATRDERNVIKVDLNNPAQSIRFESLCLIPGESCAYTISLSYDQSGTCDLRFDFSETEEKTLKHYAYVRIESDGTVLYDRLLADAFLDENILLPVDFDAKKNTELAIIYYLPIEVGNEAQNAEAIFELLVTASNE